LIINKLIPETTPFLALEFDFNTKIRLLRGWIGKRYLSSPLPHQKAVIDSWLGYKDLGTSYIIQS